MPSIVVTNTKTERKIMGLAASQARFLAITSRKMNCEFQSMQFAQQKLSVTRDLQKASKDYQNALNASKLVWETEDGSVYNLTYDTMMKPTVLNEYDPYILTDKLGRVVLNKSSFAAAVAAGVIDEKGNPTGNYTCGNLGATSDGSRNAFLNQLGVRNQIAVSVADSVFALGAGGYTSSGIGGPIFDKTMAATMGTHTFIDYLKNATIVNEDGSEVPANTLKGDFSFHDKGGVVTETSKLNFHISSAFDDSTNENNKFVIMKNGTVLNEKDIEALTLGDILTGDYSVSILADTDADKTAASTGMHRMVTLLHNSLFNVLNTDDEAKSALGNALEFTKALYNNPESSNSNKNYISRLTKNDTAVEKRTDCILSKNTGSGVKDICTASLTNMLKAYLTNFAVMLEGYGNGLYIDKKSTEESVYITDDLNYSWFINNPNAVAEQDMLNADFYNMLYNNICMYGACTDEVMQEQVMDEEYLSYALKNGQMFISSLHDDGYFYQGHYTQNGHVGEVPDEDAIARAELEYNVTKSKLNYKEETLELKMKNLDMEISALTTEFDTVKSLISKNIEKVFTMFSS